MIEDNSKFVKFVRKYFKNKIINSTDGFKNHDKESQDIYDLIKRSIEKGESNSALIVGPPGSGKTILVKSVLKTLEMEVNFNSNAILIQLHGLIHTDDNLALKSIATQMNVNEDMEGKIFGTFAENLQYLLGCLRTGHRETSKSLIFILEDFDLFCSHNNQTLLYNLLDMIHNSPIPICVLGLTCRIDVMELFEKRVKSRFGDRLIFIFPGLKDDIAPFDLFKERVENLLKYEDTLEKDNKKFANDVKQWNKHIESLMKDKKLVAVLEEMHNLTVDERDLKNLLINVVSKLEDVENFEQGFVIKDKLTYDDFSEEFKMFNKDSKVLVLQDLSVLEICLLIAIKHHCDIYDSNPFNFEMILTRYNKFANSNTLTHAVQRPVVLKAFEHIAFLELIAPISNTNSRLQKEYQLYKPLFLNNQLNEALKHYIGLPTEVKQWASSSLA